MKNDTRGEVTHLFLLLCLMFESFECFMCLDLMSYAIKFGEIAPKRVHYYYYYYHYTQLYF